jgi:apolipoprotein N-acyltransferase
LAKGTTIELSGIGLLFGLVFILAIREWFVEFVLDDVTAFLHATPIETWFIIAVLALVGAIGYGMSKK